MSAAVWQPEYETGHSKIDDQHQTLFKLIDNLANAISQNSSQEVLRSLLDELVDDTTNHFAFEENLVKHRSFPRFFIHRAGHHNILDSLLKVSAKFRQDSSFLTLEIVESLKDAILKHMGEEDLPMARELNLSQEAEIKAR